MKLFSLLALSQIASGAIGKHRILAATATDDTVSQADAATPTRKLVGVSMNVETASGARLDMHVAGVVPVKYGGTVAFGDPLTSDSTGRAVKATPGQPVLGTAMENGVVDEIGSVKIGDQAGSREQAISGTLVAGECVIATGITVTADSKAEVIPSAVITGSTNFACLAHLVASNTPGAPGVGAITIQALGANGAKDVDAAGTFHGTLKG